MKNQKVVEELKNLDPEKYVEITLDMVKKSLLEICYHNGTRFEKNFSCQCDIVWRGAELSTKSMTVSEIIEVLENKTLNEMSDLDFNDLTIETSTDGSVDVSNIEWDVPLTEEEESEITPNDLYWDSDITDSELQFNEGSIYSMTIKCEDYEAKIED